MIRIQNIGVAQVRKKCFSEKNASRFLNILEHGFCGGTQEHCYCETCVNYRPINLSGKVRSDRR